MLGAGMGSKRVLFTVLSLAQLAAAVGTCSRGDCVIFNHPGWTEKSWDNTVPFVTAVGCEKTFTIVFGQLANSTGTPTVTVESKILSDPPTTADQTSLVTGTPLAERLVTCCARHPIDKELLDATAGDGGAICGSDITGVLTNFDCMTIKQTAIAGGYVVIEVGISPRLYPWPLDTASRRACFPARGYFLSRNGARRRHASPQICARRGSGERVCHPGHCSGFAAKLANHSAPFDVGPDLQTLHSIQVTFIAPYKSDVDFAGASQICLRAAHDYPAPIGTALSEQYCVDIQVCSSMVRELN